jgi:predicted ATP-grasp superfamily ATP-dependent carboligase
VLIFEDQWRIPILILGTGVTALGVQRVLGRRGLQYYTCDGTDRDVRRSRWYRPLPAGCPAPEESELPAWLESLDLESAVLIPCSDQWAVAVADLPDALRTRFRASVAPSPLLRQLVDKRAFLRTVVDLDIPHPWTMEIVEPSDLDRVDPARFGRAFLKPADSQSFMLERGVKALHVASPAEARSELDRCAGGGAGFLLQEYVPGPASNHVFVDGFVDAKGVCRVLFARRRLRMYPVDFGNSSFMRSVDRAEVSEAVESIRRLVLSLGYRGPFSAEFKQDERDGIFRILEVNARAWWYVEFAAQCGVDVCALSYLDALGADVPSIDEYAVGVPCVYPYYDYFACQALLREGRLTRRSWLRSWLGSRQPVFQWADPWPALRGGMEVGAGLLRKRARRAFGFLP